MKRLSPTQIQQLHQAYSVPKHSRPTIEMLAERFDVSTHTVVKFLKRQRLRLAGTSPPETA